MSLLLGVAPVGFKEAEKALEGIKNAYPKAVSDAINRGLLAGRTEAAQAISARYDITSANVKEGFEMDKATWNKLEGSLTAKGPMMKVSAFHTNVKKDDKGRSVVYATIVKGKKKLVKNAFLLSGGRIMERRQPGKYPIFPVMTIGIPQMASQNEIAAKIQEAINKATAARLEHNVKYALGQIEEHNAKVKLVANTKLTPQEAQAKLL
jgi:Prophage minor tail protein Z (GPZ)